MFDQRLLIRNITIVVAMVVLTKPQRAAVNDGPVNEGVAAVVISDIVICSFGAHLHARMSDVL